jgi:hypothetical protein
MARKPSASKIHDRIRALEQRCKVDAFIVLNQKREHVGTVRIHYPRDGAGRLTVVAADWTLDRPEGETFETFTRWQVGTASGGGYDKATAAAGGMTIAGVTLIDEGAGWYNQLRNAGFDVLQAV